MTITPPHPKKLGYSAEDMLLAGKQRAKTLKMPFLPVELIANILGYLESIDLIHCKRVCKFFDRLVHESSRLMYTLELAKARMVSVLSPEETPTFASRLELLRRREQDWRVLGWKRRTFVDLPPTGSLYEFVGGVYANGREGDNRLTTSISFLELPSADTREDQLQTWSHSMPDLNIIDFTMDPGQDLLVLVAVAPAQSEYIYELHIRSIKTNQPHTKAPSCIFPCMRKPHGQTAPIEVITAVRVQVCGDLVALLIKDVMENSGGHLEIWNWTAGPTHSCSLPRTQGIDDFSFLTPSVALIVRPTGQFEVYDFLDPAHHSSEPTLRYAFAFPPLSPGYSYWYISMSNNPTPGYIPNPAEHKANMRDFLKGDKQVYHPDPKERVHSCCLYVFNPADPVLHAVSSFVFFIKIETLLNPPMFWFQRPFGPEGRVPYCHPSVFEGQPEFLEGMYMWQKGEEGEEVHVRGDGREGITRGRGKGKAINETGPSSRSSSMDSIYGSGHVTRSEAGAEPPPDSQESLPEIELDVHGFLTGDNDYEQLYGPGPFHPFHSTTSAGSSTSQPAYTTAGPSSSTSATLTGEATLGPFAEPNPPEPISTEPHYAPVPWDVWGQRNTRWFEECLSTDWQHAIYGLRAVESVEVSKMTAERQFDIDNWPVGRDASTSDVQVGGGPSMAAPAAPTTTTTVIGGVTVTMTTNGLPRREKRFLRVRDFSPYSIKLAQEAAATRASFFSASSSSSGSSSSSAPSRSTPSSLTHDPHDFTSHPIFKGKGKCRSVWRTPKVVVEPSRVPALGVFQHDIVSMLPYVETVSDETFEVTDVMMDDERILLLKRGTQGRLKSLEVLMM